jgi:hypothetical protein
VFNQKFKRLRVTPSIFLAQTLLLAQPLLPVHPPAASLDHQAMVSGATTSSASNAR